jgi:methionyl-tRNA formyltransferase
MLNKKIKIIYWGTPHFSAEILKSLINTDFKPMAVVTQSDKPAGRGSQLKASEVKILAEKEHILCFQPEKLKNLEFLNQLKKLKPDLFIVASYGKIIPKEILDIPKLRTINVHPSLLPRWRGPSPIQSTILAGDKEVGISIMLLDEEMDHGDIISNVKFPISNKITYRELEEILIKESAKLLIEILPKWIDGKIKTTPQNHKDAVYCKMIKKEDGRIDWNESVEIIDRKIRALNPWPGTYFEACGKKFKVLEAEIKLFHNSTELWNSKKVGEFFCENKQLMVRCKDGILILKNIQPESKNSMDGYCFWCGYQSKLKV